VLTVASAVAYLAFPHLKPAFEIARLQKLEKLAKTPANLVVHSCTTSAKTVEELAEDVGICRRLLMEAQAVHKLFAERTKYAFAVEGGPQDGDVQDLTLKEYFEPRILRAPIGGEHEQTRPMGLGAVIAGAATVKEHRKGVFSSTKNAQLELFGKAFKTLTIRAVGLPEDQIRAAFREQFEKISDPEEMERTMNTLALAHAEARRAFQKTTHQD